MWILALISANPIWQSLWFIAMIIAFVWLNQKDDQKTLKIIFISMLFWWLHFYYMWMYSALAVNIIWIIRLFLSLKYKKNKRIFLWVISATIVLWFFTYENIYSTLPIVWSCISAYWYFFFERVRLRLFMFISSLFRFTFSVNFWLIWWTINEAITQVILIVAMYKMIHEEWKRVYFVDRVITILSHQKPDVGRFIDIYDFIKMGEKSFKEKMYINISNIKNIIIKKIEKK